MLAAGESFCPQGSNNPFSQPRPSWKDNLLKIFPLEFKLIPNFKAQGGEPSLAGTQGSLTSTLLSPSRVILDLVETRNSCHMWAAEKLFFERRPLLWWKLSNIWWKASIMCFHCCVKPDMHSLVNERWCGFSYWLPEDFLRAVSLTHKQDKPILWQ